MVAIAAGSVRPRTEVRPAPFSISEHSAGISSLQPAELLAVAAQQDAAAAVPDGPSAELDAVVAEPAEAAAAQPFGAVVAGPPVAGAALASPSEEPDAAAGAEAQPGVAVALAGLAAVLEASVWPAEWALKALQRAAGAAEARLASAPFPE